MMRARMVAGVVAGWVLFSAAPAVASTFTVTNTEGSGSGSLAAAVAAANAATPPTVVDFAPGVAGIINLTGGELMINRSMTIDGPGATPTLTSTQGGYQSMGSMASSCLLLTGGPSIFYRYLKKSSKSR